MSEWEETSLGVCGHHAARSSSESSSSLSSHDDDTHTQTHKHKHAVDNQSHHRGQPETNNVTILYVVSDRGVGGRVVAIPTYHSLFEKMTRSYANNKKKKSPARERTIRDWNMHARKKDRHVCKNYYMLPSTFVRVSGTRALVVEVRGR